MGRRRREKRWQKNEVEEKGVGDEVVLRKVVWVWGNKVLKWLTSNCVSGLLEDNNTSAGIFCGDLLQSVLFLLFQQFDHTHWLYLNDYSLAKALAHYA